MGIVIVSDVFQSRLPGLFRDLPYVLVYIDDIAIICNGTFEDQFEDHLEKIKEVLHRLQSQGMQVNPLNLFWAKD